MATAADIINGAYWMAGILSPPSQTANATYTSLALAELNKIVDEKRRFIWFNVQYQTLAINATTQFIYIGNTVSSADVSVTVVNQPFFSIILSATARSENNRFSLSLFDYSYSDNINYTQTSGMPKALYYSNFVDDENNFYTKIEVTPASTSYSFSLTGIAGLDDFGSDTGVSILTGMSQYLQYELSKRLAAIFYKLDTWIQKNEATRMELESELKGQINAPIQPTSTSFLCSFGRYNLRNM